MNTQFNELTKRLVQSVTRYATLKKFGLAGVALACAGLALVLGLGPVNATAHSPVRVTPIIANAGSTAVLAPTADSTVFKATVAGVIQSLSLGTCVNSAALEVRFPTSADQPVTVNGTATWTTINGQSSLNVTVTGTATPDQANSGFFNAKYQVTITGGTGVYAGASGLAEIAEVVMFTSQTTATATWNLKGFVVSPL